MMSRWPLVMGSKLPGQMAMRFSIKRVPFRWGPLGPLLAIAAARHVLLSIPPEKQPCQLPFAACQSCSHSSQSFW